VRNVAYAIMPSEFWVEKRFLMQRSDILTTQDTTWNSPVSKFWTTTLLKCRFSFSLIMKVLCFERHDFWSYIREHAKIKKEKRKFYCHRKTCSAIEQGLQFWLNLSKFIKIQRIWWWLIFRNLVLFIWPSVWFMQNLVLYTQISV
jgi:hypothetical protein